MSGPPPAPSASSTTDLNAGQVTIDIAGPIATLAFYHPKGNSLPAALLAALAGGFDELAQRNDVRVIVLRSEGGTFCAGASFEQLKAIRDAASGKEFFMGFARVILAMRRCPIPIVARVHGKVVGGGVGLVAAADYAIGVPEASIRLSEVAIGLGPFVVGPVVERRLGRASFGFMALDADWRDAAWALAHGFYARLCDNVLALDQVLATLTTKLASYNPDAMRLLKQVRWEGTDHWETMLDERAAMSGTLALSEFTRRAIASFEAR